MTVVCWAVAWEGTELLGAMPLLLLLVSHFRQPAVIWIQSVTWLSELSAYTFEPALSVCENLGNLFRLFKLLCSCQWNEWDNNHSCSHIRRIHIKNTSNDFSTVKTGCTWKGGNKWLFSFVLVFCSPGCPGACSVDQAGFKFKRSPCLCLFRAGIKGVHHHYPTAITFLTNKFNDYLVGCRACQHWT